MPELPELEVVREVLERRVVGQTIASVDVAPAGGPIVIRDLTREGFAAGLTGVMFVAAARRGKFVILTGEPEIYLVINPKLTGRLQLAAAGEKRHAKTHVTLALSGGGELRYVDQKRMGQLYLTREPPERAAIPDFAGMGPEPLAVTRAEFLARLRPFRGEIKGILTRGDFLAGIGNAYADEILWAARLHPYRKRTSLSAEELDALYAAVQSTLLHAIEKVRAEVGEDIHLEPRDFMAVHMRAGAPCPRCGTPISLIGANQRITNFCRTCQPGGLIKGM
jgi:formamidopyrimidine-DNA glycosylase